MIVLKQLVRTTRRAKEFHEQVATKNEIFLPQNKLKSIILSRSVRSKNSCRWVLRREQIDRDRPESVNESTAIKGEVEGVE